MSYFRSTILKGGSWHAWPDNKGYTLWSLPNNNQPGNWREALATPTIPHGNGLHAARWHALAYWFGPLNFSLEIDPQAQKENDHDVNVQNEDIIVCRRGRLEHSLPMNLEKWQDVTVKCASLLSDFPKYYNYEGRYDERADLEAHEHPGAYPIYRNAQLKYDWRGAIKKVSDFFEEIRKDEYYIPGVIEENISTLGEKYKANALLICHHLDKVNEQMPAHLQSVARCEEYNHHSDAIIHAMNAVVGLKKWIEPWASPASADQPNTSEAIASTGHGILKSIVQHVNYAYCATGAEQHRLMVTDQHTMENGLGPLLENLLILSEKHLNYTSPSDLAGRGAMLKMGEFLAEAFEVTPLYNAEMKNAKKLGAIITRIVDRNRDFSID